ncbi:YlbF family regulator [Enterococcus columbae]|uniref:YlbF family regulator n=1 Tax=Enterococcus columbae DSM 7374 = ATCC 51263 TaxID=1121865 RepID=S1MUP6_9ENTE|nr:YlbF family regulator [Enterococcus columbae]EOT40379.1 hypothetical protein OMW_01493 [Enterococcus columbae DSM 7374 = ATCC 51263]EOW80405.1 hypothetical protein I568_02108 [Enterococcus columbae DSM 7374 = ATCC 51263]OJG23765.1 hypothetical protein RR47_GL000480 [Enterococcus columbae DSM 7374 = ATCC 51263]
MTYLEKEAQIQEQFAKLNQLLQENEVIIAYKKIAEKVFAHEGLQALEEQIKTCQKQLVQYEHYGKYQAKEQLLVEIAQLQEQYDHHPLVTAYREKLIEANDLLQYVTNRIQREVNEQIEQEGKKDAAKD